MRNLLVAASLLAVSIATLMATTSACTPAPVSPTGEGEGEGAAAGEGEGAAASEGEGAAAGEGEGAAAGEGEGEGIIANVTWYRDVLPLARQRCELCHVDGGIGPFSMENTDSVVEEQQNIAAEVDSLLMPPWMPSADCSGHTYVGERSLNPDEKALFASWAANDFALGDAADASGTIPTLGVLDRIDATLAPDAAYTPVQNPNVTNGDDYHCYLLETAGAISGNKFVTGVDIAPGTRSMVHHVLLYAVDRAAAQARDAQEATPGWTCFGGPDVDNATPNVLAAWAPGSDATLYPEGTGIQLKSTDVIVMQVHYNFANAPLPVPADLTSAQLKLEDSVSKQAVLIPLPDQDFSIPPTTDSYTHTKEMPASPIAVTAWGVLPHMHQLGTHINVSIGVGTPNEECLVDIPAWNFHWQQDYFFSDVQNVRVAGGEHVTVSCTWDNPTGNTITWGESTSDEMCLAFIYATF